MFEARCGRHRQIGSEGSPQCDSAFYVAPPPRDLKVAKHAQFRRRDSKVTTEKLAKLKV